MGVWEVGFSQILKMGGNKKSFGKYASINASNAPV